MRLIDEPEQPRYIQHDIPEHQVLLSFNEDLHAEMFRDWWNEKGWKLFKQAAKEGQSDAY